MGHDGINEVYRKMLTAQTLLAEIGNDLDALDLENWEDAPKLECISESLSYLEEGIGIVGAEGYKRMVANV